MAGEERISGTAMNKLGSSLYCSIKENNTPEKNNDKKKCYRCGLPFQSNHVKKCKAINSKYLNCSKIGYFAKVCCQHKTLKVIEDKSMDGVINGESGSENET